MLCLPSDPQIEDLTGNLKKARKSDEEIAAILDRQQKEWEVNDKRKEEELNHLRKKVSQLEQQLRMVGADKDKKTVSKLTKVCSISLLYSNTIFI